MAAARAAAAVPATLLDNRKRGQRGFMDEIKAPGSKKPYSKPELKRVDLRPEEAVLGNCKMSISAGPGSGSSCKPAGSSCSTQGS